MRRLLAIVFVVTLLLTSYFIPVTSVFATEVIWGDNNTYTWTTDQYEIFKKTAVMSMIPDLLSSGINELSIENASDVDDFVDNIIEFIENNPDAFINTYTWSTLNELNQAIKEKTEQIGNEMISKGIVVTGYDGSLHSIYEPQYNNTIPKIQYKANPNFVPLWNRLSNINSPANPTPNPNPDYSFLNNLPYYFYNNIEFLTSDAVFQQPLGSYGAWVNVSLNFVKTEVSWFADGTIYHISNNNGSTHTPRTFPLTGILRIDYDTETKIASYSGAITRSDLFTWNNTVYSGNNFTGLFYQNNKWGSNSRSTYTNFSWQTTFEGTSTFVNYIYQHFCNCDVYVDGELWAQHIISSNNPTMNININGIDFYGGTGKPINYYYPQGTNIDYQKLYEVIKHAINNQTPISNQTIWEGDTYYDSHDNIYSPTIYNYYTDDDEDENDIINDLLTLAIVPEFDTALLEPIETPILNGEKIMFTGVQAFPDEILFVIGASFVLILFGAMINRLIE